MNEREREMLNDVEYEDLKEAFILRELEQRVKAIKLLSTTFDVDDISFSTRGIPTALQFVGSTFEFDRLAHIVDKEVYVTEIDGRQAEAFEVNGVEVYRYGTL